MIPTVEKILRMLAKGECTHDQAMNWMEQHFKLDAALPSATADIHQGALRNILGWADGIRERSKDEASRKVAGWIVDHARAALNAPRSHVEGTLDMSPAARLKDAEDDVLRLHEEKMKFFERVIELERQISYWMPKERPQFGAVGSREKSARCEKLAAKFDALSEQINAAIAGAA